MGRRHRWLRRIGLLALVLGASVIVAEAQTPKKKKGKGRDAEPKVMSAGSQVLSKTAAELLRIPGADRYDPGAVDWREVPPWRQTSFFGVRAQGLFFVYVVDCSGSMIDEDRLVRAKAELRRSVLGLQHPQRFKVIFYNDQVIPMPGDLPLSADWSAKDRLIHWLRLIEPDGETDPRGAMSLALSLRPDAVFLLSDGEFPGGTVEAIARKNPRKVPIHCIDLSGGTGGDHLRRIASDSGGQYRLRPQGGESP
jgi:hypothetical protein